MADITHGHTPTETTAGAGEAIPHPYHLLNPSPWPLLGAFAAGLLATGMVIYMHGGTWIIALLGFLSVLGVMFGWWRDIIKESVKEKAHTPIVKIGLRYGMSLFIASEVMFFSAFFWAFYDAALFPKVSPDNPAGVWPPPKIETFDPFHLPLMMTLILLLSGVTVTWAHHALQEGKNNEAAKALGITVLLGVMFSFFQGYEYSHAAFGFQDGIFPSTFYMATGFHGFHVIIGTIFLAVCWFRVQKGHFTPKSHFGFEAAAWYWHFVDVVWLFLYVSVYWWGS
ncbi:cytochrome c oxidase subunit 3 [Azospirillum sp. RWY-5-1]|uniref:cytochrome-c oxidase n=2 Tax=cellular organisms TaxID=131567 RepID=A0ABX2T8Z3_9PROT|nr:cytochrome c oxidase subunit 3 [Azospirillum oleiclasticum]NYZ13386.1 cytochrome c oxidase subunit 3 [Azospirillum oleiclasticum]NYZ20547.1 cytochrome c oxidase subunit 3 [Azospirillum oleiclasticum]